MTPPPSGVAVTASNWRLPPWSTTADSSRLSVRQNAAANAVQLTSRSASFPSKRLSSISLSASDLTTSYFRELTGISVTIDKTCVRALAIPGSPPPPSATVQNMEQEVLVGFQSLLCQCYIVSKTNQLLQSLFSQLCNLVLWFQNMGMPEI
nr:hypothetical protein Iba_chr04cCG2720 [Ipomoea batatas]